MRQVIAGFIIAAVFWFIMFSPWTKDSVNFWLVMLPAAIILIIYSFVAGRNYLRIVFYFEYKYILIGLLSAGVLYLVCYTGDYLSNLLFDFLKEQINDIYSIKVQASRLVIVLSLYLYNRTGGGNILAWFCPA
jgi:hypothetical protein